MEFRYKMDRLPVENLIWDQQKAASPAKKKHTAAKSAVKDNFIPIYCYSYKTILVKISII